MNKASEAQRRYDEKNCKRYQMKLNRITNADLIERLEKVESTQGYIKELIWKDIEEDQGRFKVYNIIEMGWEELEEELKQNDISYPVIFKSRSIGTILRKLDELKATNKTHSIEEYIENEEGEFLEGGDFDSITNFKKRNGYHA